MSPQDIINICLKKTGAYLDYPFGDDIVIVKVRGRIFAQIFMLQGRPRATFNCSEVMGLVYRDMFPEWVRRGYHCPPVQQPYFNTVDLDGGVPDEEILNMISHAYSWVVSKLPKYVRRELESEAGS